MKVWNYFDAIMRHNSPAMIKTILVEALSHEGFNKPGFEALFSLPRGDESGWEEACLVREGECVSYASINMFTREKELWGSQTAMINTLFQYHLSGRPCFVVDSQMESDFSSMSIDGIPRKHWKLPFDCFFVALPDTKNIAPKRLLWGSSAVKLPDDAIPSPVGNDSVDPLCPGYTNIEDPSLDESAAGWHRLGGFYIQRVGESGLLFQMVGRPNKHSRTSFDVPMGHLSMDLDNIDWSRPKGVIDYVEQTLADLGNEDGDPGTEVYSRDPRYAFMFQHFKECLRHVVHVAINLLLYVNSREPDLRETRVCSTSRARVAKQLRNKKMRQRSRVKLRKKLVQAENTRLITVGESYETVSRSTRQHFRKAHWHKYYVGPRKYPNGEKIPLHLQDTEILWVGMTEINKDSKYRTDSRTYTLEESLV